MKEDGGYGEQSMLGLFQFFDYGMWNMEMLSFFLKHQVKLSLMTKPVLKV
jgi:hypothetical protein